MSEREGEMTDYEAIYNCAYVAEFINSEGNPRRGGPSAGIAAVVAAAKAEALGNVTVVRIGQHIDTASFYSGQIVMFTQ